MTLFTWVQCKTLLDLRQDHAVTFKKTYNSCHWNWGSRTCLGYSEYKCPNEWECPIGNADIKCLYSVQNGWKCFGQFEMNLVIDTADVRCQSLRDNWVVLEECKLAYTLKEGTDEELRNSSNMTTPAWKWWFTVGALVAGVLFLGSWYLHISWKNTIMVATNGSSREHSPVRPAITSDDEDSETEDFCVICMNGPKVYASINCGHMCFCISCFKDRHTNKNECPVCRQKPCKWIRIYR